MNSFKTKAASVGELTNAISGMGTAVPAAATDLDRFFSLSAKADLGVGEKNINGLADAFDRVGDRSGLLKANDAVTGFLDKIGGADSVLNQVKGRFTDLDQSLTDLASNGSSQQAALGFQQIANQAAKAGTPVDELVALFPQYRKQLEDQATALHVAGLTAQDCCRKRAAELLKVAEQVVVLRRGGLGCIAGVVDLRDPLVEALPTLLVQDVRGPDGVVAEDLGEGRVPLGLRQLRQAAAELVGEVRDPDELALGVVGADAEPVHLGPALLGRVRQGEQHRLEAGAGVGPDQAGGGERGEGAGGVLDAQAELGRDEAALLQRGRHVGHLALRLAGSGCEEVRDVRHVLALELELRQGGGRGLAGLGDADLPGRGQVEGALQPTTRVSCADTPALSRFSMPVADSVALNFVVLPSSSASARSAPMFLRASSPVAATLDMPWSKSAADLTAAPNPTAAARPTLVRPEPRTRSDCSCLLTDARPRSSP